jgi:hypothetical protein
LCFGGVVKNLTFVCRKLVASLEIRAVVLGLAILLPGLLIGWNCANAQNANARIVGNVIDQNGGVIPGAKVTVVNDATQVHYDTTTDKQGYFEARDLPIGKYSVAVEADRFKKVAYEGQNLQINQVLRLDVRLEIGSVTESVEVTDQADVVETVNPTLGASVTGRTLTDMPLNGRNTLNLALLQPGVTPTNDADTSTTQGYNIAGGRSDSVTFLLDGGLNNENLGNGVVYNPNPDTIAEFRILENNYTAEYGRNGGGIITEVVKSGTNEWHGSAFDFLRNGDFNANSFFNKNNPNNLLPRDDLHRNQFGGTFGGPITIPKLVHGKDRFFFFVGYQGQRQSQTQSSTGNVVMTPAELKGDFSNGGTAPFGAANCPNADPGVAAFLTANPFFQSDPAKQACAIIDPTKINGVAQKYIGFGLIPTSPNGVANVAAPATNNDNELTMKFDFNLTQKDRLSVTLGGNRNPQLLPFEGSGLLGYADTSRTYNYFSNFAYTRIFTPNILNEFRVTVQRQNTLQAKPAETLPTHVQVGEVGITPDIETGAAKLNFLDQGTLLGSSIQGPSTLISNTFAYNDVLSWTRGRHTWKFGGSITAYQFNTTFDFFGSGEFVFVGAGGIGSGNDFADFLLGIPIQFQQGPNAPTNARTKLYSGFAQDEWRVNKKLVLTLGVRYEYSTPKFDTHGVTFNVIPGLQSTVFPNAPSGLVFPGDKGAPRGVNFPDRNNWAPRIGFAWDPKGDSKTSVRGGFGVFYDILKAEDNFQDNGQPPFFAAGFAPFSPLAANPTTDVPYLAQPYASTGAVNPFPSKPVDHNVNFFNAGFTPFGSTSIFLDDPRLKTPYIYQYNLSVQREVAKNTTVQVGYVGSSSHGLTSLVDINPFIPGTSDRILNLLPGNSSCPEGNGNTSFQCSFSNLLEFKNVSKASYNGLSASVTRQLTDTQFIGRTYFVFGYTFAHSIDNASGFRQLNSNQVPTFQPNLWRASSDFDVKHRITFSGGWDLPFDRLLGAVPKRITQGWSLYPIFSWRTGFPQTIFAQVDTSGGFTNPGVTGAGDVVPHANLTGQPLNISDPRSNAGNFYFNTNAFTTAQCPATSTTTPGQPNTCIPSATLFPSTNDVIANPRLLTYGTASRGLFRGPSRTNLDMSLAKVTAITERLKLEFRADAFNVLNHAEFADPITNINSSLFGEIVATGSNTAGNPPLTRVLQLALRLTF